MKLRKIEVSAGIYWVEVPDADLRVVCGCPADTVKHLMKRGLVVSTEVDGMPYEMGPNAILLSDVMVQNGQIANLAEFPVLQMLYRQGMIIPNHPGNTGKRPLLIGGAEQVQAQLQYIYRGNYGLISEEEIMETGIDQAAAREMMRLKLKFAFGRIHHPTELIDSIVIDKDVVNLGGGVTLRRLAVNVFEFAYGGESCTVDLNLAPFETYECPYPLSFHHVQREYFAVIHSGEGDGWDINRPSMGSVLMHQGKVYLVDAGPNIMATLMALGVGVSEIEGIFHTHSHDDHFAGLTTLIRADHRIKYYATPLVRASVAKKTAALLCMEEEDFADYFEVRDLVMGEWNSVEGLEVMPVFSPHPVETTVFLFRSLWVDGYRTYAHLADICRLEVLRGFITDDASQSGITQDFYDRIAHDYAVPVDVKKVDVGGGMIHGDAYDFRNDGSGKIILAHTSARNTTAQKAIGSTASFGTVDVLIPSNHDFIWRSAYEYLTAYFPTIPPHEIRVLLNNPVVMFNPGTILVKERMPTDRIHLLLSGSVEMIPRDTDLRAVLSAGAMVGDLSGLFHTPATETYRAMSFVRALEIPCQLFQEFVRRNNLFRAVSRVVELREFLLRTWLFGEVISTSTLNAISQGMRRRNFQAGETMELGHEKLGLVASGRAGRFIGENRVETLAACDFFNEEASVFGTPSLFRVRALEPTEIYEVPAELVRRIPSVRWKLFEGSSRRMRALSETEQTQRMLLHWHEEYSVNIQRIDNHHRRLFEIGNTVLDAVESAKPVAEVAEAFGLMVEYALFHFAEEEALLERYGYPELDTHRHRHQRLVVAMNELFDRIQRGAPVISAELLVFLQDWLVTHILREDRRYVSFLNGRGVY